MQWFRFYNEVLNDPKVQCLPGDTFKVWVNILCLASKTDGQIPSIEDVTFALRLPLHDVTSHMEIIFAAGLIDEKNGYRSPHNWKKRQFKSDTSKERVKRHRDRYKKQVCNVTVTPPDTEQNRYITEQNRVPPKSPKRGLDDLSVSDISDWLAQKRVNGKYLMHDEHVILEQFKDYCKSKGKKYADYAAAYRRAFDWESCQPRNNSQTNGGIGAGSAGPSKSRQFIDAGEAIVAKRNAQAAVTLDQGQYGRQESTNPAAIPDICHAEKVR